MNLIVALTIGALVALGVVQILQRDVIRVVVGLYTLWNAANLLIIGVARDVGDRAPIVHEGTGPMADPLVQALVLTSIVISFGFTAFLIALAFWLARRGSSVDLEDFRAGRG